MFLYDKYVLDHYNSIMTCPSVFLNPMNFLKEVLELVNRYATSSNLASIGEDCTMSKVEINRQLLSKHITFLPFIYFTVHFLTTLVHINLMPLVIVAKYSTSETN